MAINPSLLFTNQTDRPDGDYPLGKARNVTTPGDGRGTPLVESWVNDIQGLLQSILSVAEITPSGSKDTAIASQYLDGLKKIMGRSVALGTIRYSYLDETQFTAELDNQGTWVPLDGRDITGSELATISGQTEAVDMRGFFPRMVGGNAEAFGIEQDDATARNGLILNWSNNTVTSGTASISWNSSNITVTGGSHSHTTSTRGNGPTAPFSGYAAGDAYNQNATANFSTTSHSHSMNRNQWNSNQYGHNHAYNINFLNTGMVVGSDAETAPDHMNFYAYIKIDF